MFFFRLTQDSVPATVNTDSSTSNRHAILLLAEAEKIVDSFFNVATELGVNLGTAVQRQKAIDEVVKNISHLKTHYRPLDFLRGLFIQVFEVSESNMNSIFITYNEKILAGDARNISFICVHDFIGERGGAALAKTLPEYSNLASLNLRASNIGAVGTILVAAALCNCQLLTSLDLGLCYIQDIGAKALAAKLPEYSHLAFLDLSHNFITDAGIRALAAALPHCPCLVSLDLSHNSFSFDGVVELFKALENCTSLSQIRLHWDSINDQCITFIAGVLPKLAHITSLDLDENPWMSHFFRNPAPLTALAKAVIEIEDTQGRKIEVKTRGNFDVILKQVREELHPQPVSSAPSSSYS